MQNNKTLYYLLFYSYIITIKIFLDISGIWNKKLIRNFKIILYYFILYIKIISICSFYKLMKY